MDAHTATTSHIANDWIARYRLAALGITNHQTIDTLDAHAFGRAAHLVDDPVERTGLGRSRRNLVFRVQVLHHLDNADVALPDRCD